MAAEYKIKKDYASLCIKANKHNGISATYSLLMKQLIRKGGESLADIKSPKYNKASFMKRERGMLNLNNVKQRNQQMKRKRGENGSL
jgi:hypothetical protein